MAGHRNLRKIDPLMRLSLKSPLLTSSHRARKLVKTSRNSLKYKDVKLDVLVQDFCGITFL